MATLGEMLTEARLARGLTQRQAGRLAGVHGAHLCQIETGGIQHPSGALLLALAAAYGIDAGPLLEMSGNSDVAVVLELRARVAGLEAALGGVLAEFTAEAEHVEGSGWYVVWVPRKRLEAWRDTLAGAG